MEARVQNVPSTDNWKLPNHQVLFTGSRANKIIIGEVNPAFIGPPNSPRGQHLFPQPPLIPNCRALLFSGFIQDRRSGFSLISGLWIVCHVSRSARRPSINQRATSCPGNAHNRCCVVPSIFHRWIKRHVPHSAGISGFNPRAALISGIIHSPRSNIPLLASRWITCRLSNSARLLPLIQRASLGSGILFSR